MTTIVLLESNLETHKQLKQSLKEDGFEQRTILFPSKWMLVTKDFLVKILKGDK